MGVVWERHGTCELALKMHTVDGTTCVSVPLRYVAPYNVDKDSKATADSQYSIEYCATCLNFGYLVSGDTPVKS
jgi:hypothetical protein